MSGRRLGILISGRGSNLQAILDAVSTRQLRAVIGVVISNRPGAAGLERAQQAGISTVVLEPTSFDERKDYDLALVAELRRHEVDLVCLAGFMRLLSSSFVEAFANRILNVHPSLLPAFPGLHAQEQTWRHGAKVAGATVHVVTPELDAGPIVLQSAIRVDEDDTPVTLAGRILAEEHRIYPQAIEIMLDGGWHIDGRRFVRADVR